MLTLKFFRSRSSGSQEATETFTTSDVVSCVSYDVYERPNGHISIVTYPGMTKLGGCERHVSDDERDFDSCYVENIAGKTIAKYSKAVTLHGEHSASL